MVWVGGGGGGLRGGWWWCLGANVGAGVVVH